VPPLAPAKVLRTDASIPTRRRSSRASRAGASTTAAGESSQGAVGAPRPRPADQPAAAQLAATEGRPAPAIVWTQATAAAVAEAQPAEAVAADARSVAPAAEEAERVQPVAAPVVAEAQPGAVAVAPRQAPAATEAQVEVPVEAAQGSVPAGGSRAEVVEVPNDSPPPGWDH
jgi:translation initiation factor IF-2